MAETTAPPVRERALLVEVKRRQYGDPHDCEAVAELVTCDPRGGELRNLSEYSYADGFTGKHPLTDGELKNFGVHVYLDPRNEPWLWWDRSYFFKSYGPIQELDAERMVKALRYVRKQLEKYEREMGEPESFGNYLLRVGRAVGATKIITWREGECSRGSAYDASQDDRIVSDLLSGASRVNWLLKTWGDQHTAVRKVEVA